VKNYGKNNPVSSAKHCKKGRKTMLQIMNDLRAATTNPNVWFLLGSKFKRKHGNFFMKYNNQGNTNTNRI
jgi:hypothetical protein